MPGHSDNPAAPQPSWQEYGRNKKRKKRILQNEENYGERPSHTQTNQKPAPLSTPDLSDVMQSLTESMSELPDPRIHRRRRHLLIDIVVIAMCATIANADGWKDIHAWAEEHHDWLRQFLALPNGVASKDTIQRTLCRVDPEAFQECFFRWLARLKSELGGVIAIDGKAARRAKDKGSEPLHLVSAWATDQHLTLGQRRVDGKSNEITAIPELLLMLQLKGSIVTIDAMGCQKAIAKQIVDQNGDYSLAVKDNQPTLASDLREAFLKAQENNFHNVKQQELETTNKGHGRTETRYYCTMPVPKSLKTASDWKGLKSVGMTITYSSHNEDGDVRYYINSYDSDVHRFAAAVRGHWGIENSLHWVMDVTFGEDASRIRKGHGGENMSWLRRLAISLIKQDKSVKDTIRAKRLRASYNVKHLERILNAIPMPINDENPLAT